MRKQVLALFLGLLTTGLFAQKNEIKTAERAIKKLDYTTASTALKTAEGLLSNMDAKTKAKFYFLQVQTFNGTKKYEAAAQAFANLKETEAKSGRRKYAGTAKPIIDKMIIEVSKRAASLFTKDKDFKNAAKDFLLAYTLDPTDTSSLQNSALSSYNAEDFEASLKKYQKLKDLNYTGIRTIYYAKEKATGIERNLGSKSQRDSMVRLGQFKEPRDEVSASKQADIIKNIALLLHKTGKTEEAVKMIQEVRSKNPNDLSLLLTEADFYINLKRMDKFGEMMEKAIKLDPNNPILFYNLGIINSDKEGKEADALKYFKRAIELKPDYADAYTSVYRIIVSRENAINKQMEGLTDFDKYDALQAKKILIYKEALPYLEKADSLKRTVDTVKILKSLYEILEMDDKAKEYGDILKKMG
jgi:tetratricopeptide (TPR) repeat protein